MKCSLLQNHKPSWTDRGQAKGLKVHPDLERIREWNEEEGQS